MKSSFHFFKWHDIIHGKPDRLHQKSARTGTWIQQSCRIQSQCTEISAFLYTNEATERQIKKLIPFTIAPRSIKYLGINLNKDLKDLYAENIAYQGNWRRCKEMEKNSMHMDWKNKYC